MLRIVYKRSWKLLDASVANSWPYIYIYILSHFMCVVVLCAKNIFCRYREYIACGLKKRRLTQFRMATRSKACVCGVWDVEFVLFIDCAMCVIFSPNRLRLWIGLVVCVCVSCCLFVFCLRFCEFDPELFTTHLVWIYTLNDGQTRRFIIHGTNRFHILHMSVHY